MCIKFYQIYEYLLLNQLHRVRCIFHYTCVGNHCDFHSVQVTISLCAGTDSGGEAAKKRSDLLSFLDSMVSSQRKSITNVVGDDLQESAYMECMEHTQANIEENIERNEHNNEDDNDKADVSKYEVIRENKKKKLSNSDVRL